ncbi:hypothetical protein [Aeromonas media]|uniref:hypothetical protein n=1 Tax=Aeromonas media TaxID=651 RepID=UPI0029D87F08|nr:hypothetical protein [Aeromonas media]MDX7899162.1 hypothetical protein [Aeromonas media]
MKTIQSYIKTNKPFNVKHYYKNQIKTFKIKDFVIGDNWKEAISLFLYWAAPAFLTVVIVENLSETRTVEYYRQAISQGVGPVLWNFIAVFGCATFGISFIFNRVKLFSNIAHQLLINVYSIGSLNFGILFGQFVMLSPDLIEKVELWKLFIVFPLSYLLLAFVFLLNLSMWYLSHLIRWESPFLEKLSSVSWFFRFLLGSIFSSTFLFLLWIEN